MSLWPPRWAVGPPHLPASFDAFRLNPYIPCRSFCLQFITILQCDLGRGGAYERDPAIMELPPREPNLVQLLQTRVKAVEECDF